MKNEKIKEAIELYSAGVSTKDIGSKFGVSQSCIIMNLKKSGVKMRGARKYSFENPDYFSKIDTPEKAYILGFFYGDGCMGKVGKNWRFSLGIQKRDTYILEQMCKLMGYDRPILYKDNKGVCQDTATLYIYDQYICKKLIRCGIFSRKSFTLKYPEFLSENLQSDFIRGLFDSDGHIQKNGYEWCIIGTEDICNGVKKYLDKNDVVSKIIFVEEYTKPLAYVKVYNRKNILKIYELLYKNSDVCLKRKQIVFEELKNRPPGHIGEQNYNAKLNVEKVKKIKKMLKNGDTHQNIANIFGVSRRAISKINTGENWGYVK